MRLKVIVLFILIGLSFSFSKNTDTLYVFKGLDIMSQFVLQEQVDSLAFSQKSKKYQFDLFKKSKNIKSIPVGDIDSIVFFRPIVEV
ncbi:MAG: hypothetical protein GX801_10590 [Fibrobacter sp.]|nr:hypothetical protein [Fibrobacter sp.]